MWEVAAAAWGRHADRVRDWGMPVSAAMVDALALQPGQRVLELAAGPGDTGFLAAELIRPGGTLISSDGADAMLDVARARAAETGADNVEFKQLELEWIDLPTASVDAVLCRWGIMLTVDPEAAAQEARRVLKPGGRAAFAVWDRPERNPWATIPSRALISLGHAEPPDPDAPGMFRLAGEGVLGELLESAGFVEVHVHAVEVVRRYPALERYIEETADMSPMFSRTYHELDEAAQRAVVEQLTAGAQEFVADDGSVALPGSSLVAIASA
jgi:ubiquinone/menaquinone biosynthesis C-methylase UbiE